MKYVYLIGDGMADEPLEELGGKTVLEASFTPYMDSFATDGMTGMVKTVPDGIKPGSDVAIMSLMGYSPAKYYTGRSPLEAASLNIDIANTQVVFRCNLVTIEDGVMKDFAGGHPTDSEAKSLLDSLNDSLDDKEFEFFKGVSYRHILRCPDKFKFVNTVPPHDITNKSVDSFLPFGDNNEAIRQVMEKSQYVFKTHPVNIERANNNKPPITGIWLWGSGKKPAFPSFHSKYGVKALVIAAVDLVKGIAVVSGMGAPHIPGATGWLDTSYSAEVNYLIDNWHKYDFFFLHIEAPDEAGHLGSIYEKMKAIESIDEKIVSVLWSFLKTRKESVRLVIMPDHATPVKKMTHTNDEVPFVVWGNDIEKDASKVYSEKEARLKGSLKYRSPIDLIEDVVRNKKLTMLATDK